jgi:hypothetical protein
MPKASLEELKGRIAAGEYAIDSGKLAGAIFSKFELIRRVRRGLMGEDEEGAAGEAGRGPQPRGRRRARPASHPLKPRSEPLP